MDLNELYRVYGELSIQAEILNSRIVEVKKQIAEKLNANAQKPGEGKS